MWNGGSIKKDKNTPLDNTSMLSYKAISISKLTIWIILIVVGVAVIALPLISNNLSGGDEDITINEKLIRGANTTSGSVLLDDKAGLVASSEIQAVLEELQQESIDSNCNIAVLTTNEGLTDSTIKIKSESYYKNSIENKLSTNYSVILTVDIITRKLDVSCYNDSSSKQIVNVMEINQIREDIVDELSDGKYADAFKQYAKYASKIAGAIDEDGRYKNNTDSNSK